MNRLTGYKRLLALAALSGGAATVERTAAGNPMTFTTDLARPLKSLLIPFTPVQSGTGDPSPQNIRSILPWNGLNVEHFDENLLAINRTSAQTNQGITYTPIKQDNKTVAVKVEGTRTNTNPFFNLNYTTKPGGGAGISIPPGTYKIFGGTPKVRVQVFYHDANGVERIAGYDDGSGALITIPADCTASWCRLLTWVDTPVDTVIYPIIMSTDSIITRYPVTFSSPVYGGTLDVVSGVLTVEWIAHTFDGTETFLKNGTFTGGVRFLSSAMTGLMHTTAYCDKMYATGSITTITKLSVKIGSPPYQVEMYVPDNSIVEGEATKDDFTRWLSENNVTVVARLTEPQTVQLTPAQITALKGDNTIWSDADGSMTAVYLVSAAYADSHPVGGLGSGLLGFGSGNPDPDEPGEPDDEPVEPDQPADDQPEEP